MDRDYERLGRMVKRARIRRYRTVDAARGSMLSRGAWDNVEHGRPAKELTYAAVEERLGWNYGDCERILAGGDLTAAAEPLDDVEEVRRSNLHPRTKARVLVMLGAEPTELRRSLSQQLKDRGLEEYAQAEADDETPASGSA